MKGPATLVIVKVKVPLTRTTKRGRTCRHASPCVATGAGSLHRIRLVMVVFGHHSSGAVLPSHAFGGTTSSRRRP